MKEQDHKRIHIKDLVLWTENPRDPISPNASNQEIVNRAIESEKWKLRTLVKEMGDSFDESELPTVVYHGDKPIVYDGNRRMIVAKIAHNLVEINPFQKYGVKLPTFPTYIPCNVCTPERAIQNIYRKHDKTGSWLPLERDIFRHKHMKEPKSIFLLLEENTGIIRANEKMVNQRFIKEEVFTKSILEKLGLSFQGEQLMSKHTEQETYALLQDIVDRIVNKEITTRKNRGEIIKLLSPASKQLLKENKNREPIPYSTKFKTPFKPLAKKKQPRTSPLTPKNAPIIFGKKLFLRTGKVNDMYIDIKWLYDFYTKNKQSGASYNQLTRTSVHNFCTTFSLPHIPYLQNLIIHKAKDVTTKLIPTEEQIKIHAILQPISKQMVTWALSNKVARELLVLYESEEKKFRIYQMKKLLKHLTYPIHFTNRGNIAVGNYIIIQRKGGNGSLSKTIPKASIKHPGNNIQLKIKLKPFVQNMQQHELTSYTI